jgi:hypothetical protein
MTKTAEQFSPSTQARLLWLAESITASCPEEAQLLKALALEGAPRTPFGYYLETAHRESGEVVNGSFVPHTAADKEWANLGYHEVPVKVHGFVMRVRPLYL